MPLSKPWLPSKSVCSCFRTQQNTSRHFNRSHAHKNMRLREPCQVKTHAVCLTPTATWYCSIEVFHVLYAKHGTLLRRFKVEQERKDEVVRQRLAKFDGDGPSLYP